MTNATLRRAGGGFHKPYDSRICQHCERQYMPDAGAQKWCKTCVWDSASRYRVSRYGKQGLDRYREDLARGTRTVACTTCGEAFTYEYVGGIDRLYCDVHASAQLLGDRAKYAQRLKTCSRCGLTADLLDENDCCYRHHPPGKQIGRDCEICEKTFLALMSKPVRVCSKACRNARRRPLSELRSCVICDGSFYPKHPQQKYCLTCASTKSERARARRYRLSKEAVEAMSAKFGGLCWLCRELPGRCVDHCHTTGQVRGWLCGRCNTALHYVERPGWWNAASAYLSEYGAETSPA